MPSTASYLSMPGLGYDFVVATTQASINATMLNFLAARREPLVTLCWIADDEGNPKLKSMEDIKKLADNTDPFAIPDKVSPSHEGFRKLLSARFMIGIKARIGIPRVDTAEAAEALPDIVTLGSDSSAVDFNLLCSEFTIVQLNPGGGWASAPSWTRLSQPKNNPWVFNSKVDLRMSEVPGSAYGSLPPEVQQQIKNLSGTAFSIQQLLFDLTNAKLMTMPTVSGVSPGTLTHTLLQQFFMGSYFDEMQKDAQPLLGCAVVPRTASKATLTLTDLSLLVCPYLDSTGRPFKEPTDDQKNLATLNYLCAADGATLPPPVKFPWNWVEEAELGQYHGVISINRNSFTKYFKAQLDAYVPKVCFLPLARCYPDGMGVTFSYSIRPGQAPEVVVEPRGATVLRYRYSAVSEDESGWKGATGAFKMTSEYNMSVEFSGTTVKMTQNLKMWMYLRSLASKGDGNIVDKTIVDVYNLGINQDGGIEVDQQSNLVDRSQNVKINPVEDVFTSFNSISQAMKNFAQSFTATRFQNIPIETVRAYVFPGGHSFNFKKLHFSNNQDLVSFITYADTTGPIEAMTVPPPKRTVFTLKG